MPERTPWQAMLADAALMSITPDLFWRLSVREWRALHLPAMAALSRAAFEDLQRAHPDL